MRAGGREEGGANGRAGAGHESEETGKGEDLRDMVL